MEQNDLCPAALVDYTLHFSLNSQIRKNTSGLEVPLGHANSDIFKLTLYFGRCKFRLRTTQANKIMLLPQDVLSPAGRAVGRFLTRPYTGWFSGAPWALRLYSGKHVIYCGGCSPDLPLKLSWMLNYPSFWPDFLQPWTLTENLLAAKGKRDR